MKLLKLCIVVAMGFAMTSCGVVRDILEHGGAALIGEYATDGYIRYMVKSGADGESIAQMRILSDTLFGTNRIDHIKAWHDANVVGKVNNVSREVLTVLSQTEHLSDRAQELQLYVSMIDGAVGSLNELSNTRDAGERNKIIARTVFDLGTMRSEYASSSENVNRKFKKMCKKDPSFGEEYEVAEVEFDYVARRDDSGNLLGGFDRVPVKWGIVKKRTGEAVDDYFVETFISESELNDKATAYWESLKPAQNKSAEIIPTEEYVAANEQPAVVDTTVRDAEMRNKAVDSINETCVGSYEFDKTELNDTQKAELSDVASLLNSYPDLSVCLTGHTCNIGTDKVNGRKGLERAESVKMFLVEQGVSPERISVKSAGSASPLVPNNSVENRKINRRVTFTVQ